MGNRILYKTQPPPPPPQLQYHTVGKTSDVTYTEKKEYKIGKEGSRHSLSSDDGDAIGVELTNSITKIIVSSIRYHCVFLGTRLLYTLN
jgi:hypothetical protein